MGTRIRLGLLTAGAVATCLLFRLAGHAAPNLGLRDAATALAIVGGVAIAARVPPRSAPLARILPNHPSSKSPGPPDRP
jgi:hypothetical protein